MKKGLAVLFVFFFMTVFSVPGVFASDDVQMLKEQLEIMNENMKKLEEKIGELEKEKIEETEEVEYISDRLDKAELHTATDRISLGIELRSRADTLHYDDMQAAPAALANSFFYPVYVRRIQQRHIESDSAAHPEYVHGRHDSPD
ncbi:MAG: hypothetical protein K9K40_09035 [Desulfotignum sp.]|nr:hypothetical protein [Desulfotignum sp.]